MVTPCSGVEYEFLDCNYDYGIIVSGYIDAAMSALAWGFL